jgi:hypothetical protein
MEDYVPVIIMTLANTMWVFYILKDSKWRKL